MSLNSNMMVFSEEKSRATYTTEERHKWEPYGYKPRHTWGY